MNQQSIDKASKTALQNVVKNFFNIFSIVEDIKKSTWEQTEKYRQDRMVFLCSCEVLSQLIRRHDPSIKDWLENTVDEMMAELMDEWREALNDLLGHDYYVTFENGDMFAGEYREGMEFGTIKG